MTNPVNSLDFDELGLLAFAQGPTSQRIPAELEALIAQGELDLPLPPEPDLGQCSDRRPPAYSESAPIVRAPILGGGALTTLVSLVLSGKAPECAGLLDGMLKVAAQLKQISKREACVHTDVIAHLNRSNECGCRALSAVHNLSIFDVIQNYLEELIPGDAGLRSSVETMLASNAHRPYFAYKLGTAELVNELARNQFEQTVVQDTDAAFGGIVLDYREDKTLNRGRLYGKHNFTFYVVSLGPLRRLAYALFPKEPYAASRFYTAAQAFNMAGLYMLCSPHTHVITIHAI